MKKLLLLVVAMAIVAQTASIQGMERKRSAANNNNEVPPAPSYEDLDVPELMDLILQYEPKFEALINKLTPTQQNSLLSILGTVRIARSARNPSNYYLLVQDLYKPAFFTNGSYEALVKKAGAIKPEYAAQIENFYQLFRALINKLPAIISKLPVKNAPLPPLELAIKGNDTHGVLLWLNQPGFVNSLEGRQAFTVAIQNNKPEMVRLFLENKFNVNSLLLLPDGRELDTTPLMEAAQLGYRTIVQLLLNVGALAQYRNNLGQTAADLAKDDEIRNLILKYSENQ